MLCERKPRIGMLGVMYGPYEPIFPGITARQEEYAREVAASLNHVADIFFPRAALGREDIEKIIREFNNNDLDGIMIVLLTYSQGSFLVRALQENRLPVMLACIQPEQTVGEEWEELDLTINQGIHGSQDNANTMMRMGFNCEYIVENRKSERFKDRVHDWAKAAQTASCLKRMKIALLGRMPGMGDILTDDGAFLRKIGPEIVHESVGNIFRHMQLLSKNDIDMQLEKDRNTFDIDPRLPEESHRYAISMYLGFRRLLEEKGYSAFTAHFDIFQEDGRFRQLPLLGASHLMADGYGYAAEGDTITAALVATARILTGNANFSEMYAMDFEKDAIIMSHAGEGNWKTARRDKKVHLIDRVFGEGGLENPPTPVFTPEPGPAVVASLVSVAGDKFRLVVSKGDILDKADLKRIEMPYLFFKPQKGIRECVEGWLRNGASHHEVVNLGDHTAKWKMLCSILGIEYFEV